MHIYSIDSLDKSLEGCFMWYPEQKNYKRAWVERKPQEALQADLTQAWTPFTRWLAAIRPDDSEDGWAVDAVLTLLLLSRNDAFGVTDREEAIDATNEFLNCNRLRDTPLAEDVRRFGLYYLDSYRQGATTLWGLGESVERLVFTPRPTRKRSERRHLAPNCVPSEVRAELKELCRRASELTGVEHHLDHIVPLCGNTVSGLEVANNYQIMPATLNLAKSNKWWPDMPQPTQ